MKVTAEHGENREVTLTIEVDQDKLEQATDGAAKRLAGRVNIPGFRKGKAPRKIVENFVGKEAILQEAFESVAQKAFDEALTEQNMEPVTRPEIDIVTLEEGKDVVFTAKFTQRPEVTLGEYKGLKVEKPAVSVSEEDIDRQIEGMRQHQGTLIDAPADAAVKKDDFITLDFEGFVDGTPFEGGKGEDYPLQIGSGSFIPGFEDQLIGAKVGEEREVNVTFPEDYHAENLKGKAAVFKCTVRSIKSRELPELDDAFAKKASKFETLAELREDIRKNLREGAERQAENERRTKAIDMATDNCTMEIPPVMVENRITAMIQEMAMRLEQQGMSLVCRARYGTHPRRVPRDGGEERAHRSHARGGCQGRGHQGRGKGSRSGSLRNGSVLWCDAEAGSEDHQGAGARQRSCSDGAAQEDGAVHRGQYHGVRKLLRGGTYELLCTDGGGDLRTRGACL